MKQCPKCSRTYDDSQAFCLMDGTPLNVESEVETVARQNAPAPKKSRLLLWIALALLLPVLVLLGIGAAGFLFYQYSMQNENTQAKRQSNANVSATPFKPKPAPTPVDANSSPVADSSPKTDESKPTPSNENSADITPILWNTTAIGFKAEDNLTYKFQCPTNGTAGTIWGSDIYTQDSSICTAAVHAGLFTLETGGTVTIEFRPGRQTYGSTVRNGITSNTYGEYPHSFVVR